MKNLLLLGASGKASNAFLQQLLPFRNYINKLILVDKVDSVLTNKFLSHADLNYTFIYCDVDPINRSDEYKTLLTSHAIDIVLDLSDIDSLPLLRLTDQLGISYINTALNDEERIIADAMNILVQEKELYTAVPHILCSGMNPGVVNVWVEHGIQTYGVPKEVIFFEYDTSMFEEGWRPMVTWCIKEFLMENVNDPGGYFTEENRLQLTYPNALSHLQDMKSILSPIIQLEEYPMGMPVIHEENLTLHKKYNIPTKFLYSVHQKTMEFLSELYIAEKHIEDEDIWHGDNTEERLEGSDTIGILLRYEDKDIYFVNSMNNRDIAGTSATYTQMMTGVMGAVLTLFETSLEPGIYFTEDLYETYFWEYVSNKLEMKRYIIEKIEHFQPKSQLLG